MSELAPVPAPDDSLTLVEQVAAEQQTANPSCGAVQDGVPDNVCARDTGHPGPHVGEQTGFDGSSFFVQWEV